MAKETVLREAQFNQKVINYWLLSGTLTLAVTIIGVPLIPVWLVMGYPICKSYLGRMSCTLTTRNLLIKKGLLNRVEKTVPLEKITDLAMYQGPVMRSMDLKGFKVETAGSGGTSSGYLVAMVGIEDPDGFRDAVLEQRDRLGGHGSDDGPPAPGAAAPAGESDAVLIEIRDMLARIEQQLKRSGGSQGGGSA